MKIKSLLPVALAAFSLIPASAQSKTVASTAAGTLADMLTADEITSVKELVITGPINKSDFNTILTMTALETLDIKGATIAEEIIGSTTYPANELPAKALDAYKVVKTLILPTSITAIGKEAIQFTNLEKIDFSGCVNLKTIGELGCQSNKYLYSIDLSGLTALETIELNAFNSCGSSQYETDGVTPNTETNVINLSGCTALKKIANYGFSNVKNTATGGMINLSGCTSLLSIGEAGFLNVKATKVDLSECSALESIGKRAFSAATATTSTITDIKLPESLNTITTEAFRNQKKLAAVSILATVPPTCGASSFYATDGVYTATLTVPVGTKAAYEANDEWKKFQEIVEASGSSVAEIEAANVTVAAVADAVIVSGLENGAVVNVYDVAGKLVAAGVAADGIATVTVSANGVFIVKAGGIAAKVRL